MSYNSPNGSTPGKQDYYYDEKYVSPSPTPSPRGQPYFYPQTPQQRPATRAHFRNPSSGTYDYASPRTPQQFSPRYTSDGQYATANVSSSRSSRKYSWSEQERPRRERRRSASYHRASDLHGESDEDELIEINGITYVLPARSKFKRYRQCYVNPGGYETDHRYYAQTGAGGARQFFESRDPLGYNSPRHEPERRPAGPAGGHGRRNSTSVPQRPQTARPSATPKKAAPAPAHRFATEADAKKHHIPQGYSLKNWDPDEEPIMLLGSVFDANSLGKWIFDWTVYKHTANHPMSEMAGELWLLLIQLSGKIKRSDEVLSKVRAKENKEMIEDFIESGERLTDKLRKLLKTCEQPMLKSAKKAKDNQLGHNAGVEFVNTLFGRERELEKTERFMVSVRLWNLRFDANCDEIIKNPTV